MQDFAKRRGRTNIRRILLNLLGVLVLCAVAALAVRAAWGMYGKFTEAAQSDALSQQQLAALQAQQAQVTASVDSFSSPRGLEEQVRDRYGMVKPGEGQIQIVRDSASTTPQSEPPPNAFVRAWQALFGWI